MTSVGSTNYVQGIFDAMVLLEHAKIIGTLIGKNFTGPDFNFQREWEEEEENRVHSFQKSQ